MPHQRTPALIYTSRPEIAARDADPRLDIDELIDLLRQGGADVVAIEAYDQPDGANFVARFGNGRGAGAFVSYKVLRASVAPMRLLLERWERGLRREWINKLRTRGKTK